MPKDKAITQHQTTDEIPDDAIKMTNIIGCFSSKKRGTD